MLPCLKGTHSRAIDDRSGILTTVIIWALLSENTPHISPTTLPFLSYIDRLTTFDQINYSIVHAFE